MRILYGTDGSKAAANALEQFLTSFHWAPGTEVNILAVEPLGFGSGPGADAVAETNLAVATARCEAHGVRAIATIRAGDPAAAILEAAERTRPGLVVLGEDHTQRGGDLTGSSIGHVAATVALNGHASVLVAASAAPISQVILGSDGSVESERAILLLLSLPFVRLPHIIVVTVPDPTRPDDAGPDDPIGSVAELASVARAIAADSAARLVKVAARTETRMPSGEPAEQLSVVAREVGADLVVVGTRGLNARKRRRLGSVTQALIHRMPASLLIARTAPDAE